MFLVKRPLIHTFCLVRVPEIVLVVQIAGNISRIAVAIEYKVVASSGGFQLIPEMRRGRIDEATSCPAPFADPKRPIAFPSSFLGNHWERSRTIDGKTIPPEAPAMKRDASMASNELPVINNRGARAIMNEATRSVFADPNRSAR